MAESDIINQNRQKEILDVSRAAAPRRPLTVQDVTKEYLASAAPGQGSITYEDGYKVKGHTAEIDMAGWIHDTFGGDIKLLTESTKKNQETPDYLWHEKLWELKGSHSISGADKAFQHAIKQIQDNPGGFILNLKKN